MWLWKKIGLLTLVVAIATSSKTATAAPPAIAACRFCSSSELACYGACQLWVERGECDGLGYCQWQGEGGCGYDQCLCQCSAM